MSDGVHFGPWILTIHNGKVVRKVKRPLLQDGKQWTKTQKGWVRQ